MNRIKRNMAKDNILNQEESEAELTDKDSDWPKISVISVFYNPGPPLLEQTIISVLEQNYPNLDYILIDDGSTDGSEKVVQKYRNHVTYCKRHVTYCNNNEGIYNAMNHGIRLATGEWVNFLNCGDVFNSNRIMRNIGAQIKKFPEVDFIYGKHTLVNAKGDIKAIRGKKVGKRDWYFKTAICHQSVFIKKSLFSEIGLYDDSMKITADYDWFVKYFARPDIHPLYMDQLIVDYLLDGASFKHRLTALKERLSIVKMNYPGIIYFMNLMLYVLNKFRVKFVYRYYNNKLFKLYRKVKYGS